MVPKQSGNSEIAVLQVKVENQAQSQLDIFLKVFIGTPVFNTLIDFMCLYMLRIIIKELKIFKSIVISLAIYMMNYLILIKKSAKMFFYNQPMLKNIPLTLGGWVMGLPNKTITMIIKRYAPLAMITPRVRTFLRAINSFCKSMTFETIATFATYYGFFTSRIMALSRAINSFIGNIVKKSFSTPFTNMRLHQYLYYNIKVNESKSWL